MIDYETYSKIKLYKERDGLNVSQIAGSLGLDWRTVDKWYSAERYTPRTLVSKASKLDPYKDFILRELENHSYTAQQLFQKIRRQGFDGGYTIVKDYVRKVRPPRRQAYLTLSFAPGECAHRLTGANTAR